ncbi:MAG: hypothetical protein CHACPFDD_00562 [Phycisphaerae bacterium]|nr:hypothetical protein [Phycisphaerae bacterium]
MTRKMLATATVFGLCYAASLAVCSGGEVQARKALETAEAIYLFGVDDITVIRLVPPTADGEFVGAQSMQRIRLRSPRHDDVAGVGGANEAESGGAVGWKFGRRGDLNCDGRVNSFDLEPFLMALTEPEHYMLVYGSCDRRRADINGDGKVDGFDIDPFIALLLAGVEG